jgi:FdhD protein
MKAIPSTTRRPAAARDSSPASATVPALHLHNGVSRPVDDDLVAEGALQIVLNGAPYSVTMRTPGDDTLLALGLLFTEGLLRDRREVAACEEIAGGGDDRPDTVSVAMASAGLAGKNLANRRLASNASCGVCGKISADDLQLPGALESETPVCEAGPAGHRLDPALLPALEGRMRSAQALFSRTGGCHAAAVFDRQGDLLVLKEDVGRHNAVDKAVGSLLQQDRLERASILFISGRVSYEIVTKASRAGIPFLIAVSAPSTLAVRMCRETGITLIAFCRGEKATVYTHPGKVIGVGGGDLNVEGMEA